MRLNTLLTALTATISSVHAQSDGPPGYTCHPHCVEPTIPLSNNKFNFGKHYAVLNLDLINFLVEGVNTTAAGKSFISNIAKWIDAVHQQNPRPLSIFSRIYTTNSKKPEIGAQAPFAVVAKNLGTKTNPSTAVYPAFTVDREAGDVVLQKTRYYAGAGNALEEILRTQKIDTVVISGIRTSGVVLSTAIRLFDLDYHVYVIANNTIESPPDDPSINYNILQGVLPKLPLDVITIEQAMEALERSGPAVY